ncbi:MAG: phosphatidylserine decarboxylase family protein [Thermodesulfobacteriota bacterium]|nr:phosphatidylserine decarboxylase family protein [Thermodesulfobacteriota bacterium]
MAREGLPFVLIGCALFFLSICLGLYPVSIFAGILTLFFIFFFRDPHRDNSVPDRGVLTPADGRILEIQHIEGDNNPLGRPAVKVSIFMSIFNVHVNRIPIGGTIQEIIYRPGSFFSANLDKASELNENNMITLKTPDSRKIVFIQIAGLIARRISCWVKEGDHVAAGQRFGLIRFGSRLEVYIPGDSRITARIHQKVKAGKTIIGYLS